MGAWKRWWTSGAAIVVDDAVCDRRGGLSTVAGGVEEVEWAQRSCLVDCVGRVRGRKCWDGVAYVSIQLQIRPT